MDENPRIGELRKKIEKDPGSRLFAQLAEELRKEGRHEDAIAVARGGLEKHPNYPSARLTLARALLDAKRSKEARSELEHIVKASPDNILARRLLAEVLDEMGEASQAIEQFERTLQLAPDDKGLTEKVADLKRRTGEITRRAAEAEAGVARPVAPVAATSVLPSFFETVPVASAPAVLPSVFQSDEPAGPPAAVVARLEVPRPPVPRPTGAGLQAPPAAPPAAPRPPVASAPPAVLVPAPVPQPTQASVPPGPPAKAASAPPLSSAPASVRASPPVASPAPPVSVAFDRDLASGTFSPGALNVADLQKHFEAVANAERQAAADAADSGRATADAAARRLSAMDTADTMSLELPPELVSMSEDASSEFPSVEMAPEDDIGGQTLPLTSMTLADLYLQQGLKKEASAVLSQVLREEPENARARTKFAEVGSELREPAAPRPSLSRPPVAETAPSPKAPVAPARPRRTKAEVRERMIHDLRAFEGAAEREALHQRATEMGVY